MSFYPTSSQQATVRSILRKLKVREQSDINQALFECVGKLIDENEKLNKRITQLERK